MVLRRWLGHGYRGVKGGLQHSRRPDVGVAGAFGDGCGVRRRLIGTGSADGRFFGDNGRYRSDVVTVGIFVALVCVERTGDGTGLGVVLATAAATATATATTALAAFGVLRVFGA